MTKVRRTLKHRVLVIAFKRLERLGSKVDGVGRRVGKSSAFCHG